jgi:hypothetical protein
MSTQLKWRARRRHRTNPSALKNLLLLGEGPIKRQIARPLHQEWQIRIIEPCRVGREGIRAPRPALSRASISEKPEIRRARQLGFALQLSGRARWSFLRPAYAMVFSPTGVSVVPPCIAPPAVVVTTGSLMSLFSSSTSSHALR